MAQIKLNNGSSITVDDEDLELVSKYKWYINSHRQGKYISIVNNQRVKIHRMILNVSDPMVKIDHKNGDTFDNRKENLRIATNSQNQANKPKVKGTSRFKGVHKRKCGGWHCQIAINRKKIYIGVFDDEVKAAISYDIKAKELSGEFAKTNF